MMAPTCTLGEQWECMCSRIQGASDLSHLTDAGKEQAEATRRALEHFTFGACVSSPISRAREYAQVLWTSEMPPVEYMDELKEANLGILQGMMNEEAAKRFPGLYGTWRNRPSEFSINGRSPVHEVFEKARCAWQKLLLHRADSLLVVTHKSILRALVCTALELPPSSFRAVDIHNAGIVIFVVNTSGEPMLQGLNLTAHLHCADVRY